MVPDPKTKRVTTGICIVDAHSTLHAVAELRQLYQRDWLSAMQRLIARTERETSCLLVFDGDPIPQLRATNTQLAFAGKQHAFENADFYILEIVRKQVGCKVVTQDAALASAIRQIGATVIAPSEWYFKHRDQSSAKVSASGSSGKGGPGGTQAEWIALFTTPRESDEPPL